MALIKCRECGQSISNKATSCPACGAPRKKSNAGCFVGLLFLGIAIVLPIALGNLRERQEIKTKEDSFAENQRERQERKTKKDSFASDIDKHYEELTRYASQGDMAAVLKKVEEFRKQGKMDFKNVQGIYAGARERQLKDELKRIDAKDHKSIYRIYRELASLYPKDYKEEADRLEKKEEADRLEKKEEADRLEKLEARKKQIEEQFAWDGSHITLTEVIKEAMNDPDSYQHVETVYSDKGNHLTVKTTFRGKNVFGGMVINWVVAEVDLEGNILEIIEQGGPYWRYPIKPRRLRRPSFPQILLEH